jgi:hypothetical protein
MKNLKRNPASGRQASPGKNDLISAGGQARGATAIGVIEYTSDLFPSGENTK